MEGFEGWQPEAFAILERLRQRPHITQYREEKPGIYRFLKEPFKRYRDDLVVRWVLRERLDFETERNVFSRLLKNDFGAGGCHHHLWMSFYRPGRRRLTDVQLSHAIRPDGFDVGLYLGERAGDLFRDARRRIVDEPRRFLDAVNPLLADDFRLWLAAGSGKSERRPAFDRPLDVLPEDAERMRALWLRRRLGRDDVLDRGPALVDWALDQVHAMWPVYRLLAE